MTEETKELHSPITETHYCYCNECVRKVAAYMNRWADEMYSGNKK